jgi:hypothetical protein
MGQSDKVTNNKEHFPTNIRQAKNEYKNYIYIYKDDKVARKLEIISKQIHNN